LAVTGEIPDVRTVPATRDVVHPTVVRLPIAIARAKNNLTLLYREGAKGIDQGGGAWRVLAGARCVFPL